VDPSFRFRVRHSPRTDGPGTSGLVPEGYLTIDQVASISFFVYFDFAAIAANEIAV
jgi:hypothetical protein